MTDAVELDAFDIRLLTALQEDGRLSNQQLAGRVQLSASQCSRRRLRLEKAGLVKGCHATLDPELLGLHVTCFTRVTLHTHSARNTQDFVELIRGLDCVLEAYSLTGDNDYALKIVVPDTRALSAVVTQSLLAHPAVARVRSTIVLDTLKDATPLPLSARIAPR